MNQTNGGKPASTAGAWTAAIAVIAISLLSTFTLSKPDRSSRLATTDNGGSTTGSPSVTPLLPSLLGGTTGLVVTTSGTSGTSTGGTSGTRRVVGGTSGSGGSSGTGSASTGPVSVAGSTGGTTSSGTTGRTSTSSGSGGSSTGTSGGTTTSSADCSKKQNAGATDQGVTSTSINFAATVVKTGIAKDFLSDAQFGIEAVRRKVNALGGVCGRQINVKYDDDGWLPAKGNLLIQKYIGSKQYFGLAVNPSSEGLRFPILSHDLDTNQFPVIGADGMLIGQYQDPWVWPVATSTHSIMHIMADDAKKRGAHTFAIIYDKKYRFGVEGEKAFQGEVGRIGGTMVVDEGILGGLPSYSNQVNEVLQKCKGTHDFDKCLFVALLLEPATAEQWVRNGGLGDPKSRNPKVFLGASEPLFVTSFAQDCGAPCNNLRVWTSFKPPLSPFDGDPKVAQYKNDLASVSSTADAVNPHVEGAYVGMQLLVAALRKLGPAPTRAAMKTTLDSMTLDVGLGPPLQFSAGNHFASTSAQAYLAVYNVNSFVAWRYSNTNFVADNAVQQDL
jgi:ABC-type branched-subunit amino acid transport system substrate-binding protein